MPTHHAAVRLPMHIIIALTYFEFQSKVHFYTVCRREIRLNARSASFPGGFWRTDRRTDKTRNAAY